MSDEEDLFDQVRRASARQDHAGTEDVSAAWMVGIAVVFILFCLAASSI